MNKAYIVFCVLFSLALLLLGYAIVLNNLVATMKSWKRHSGFAVIPLAGSLLVLCGWVVGYDMLPCYLLCPILLDMGGLPFVAYFIVKKRENPKAFTYKDEEVMPEVVYDDSKVSLCHGCETYWSFEINSIALVGYTVISVSKKKTTYLVCNAIEDKSATTIYMSVKWKGTLEFVSHFCEQKGVKDFSREIMETAPAGAIVLWPPENRCGQFAFERKTMPYYWFEHRYFSLRNGK